MQIKVINVPAFSGFVWAEVCAGVSFFAGVGISLYPF